MLSFILSLTTEQMRSNVETIYRAYHTDMIRLAKSVMKNYGCNDYGNLAEDAVHNTFVKIAKKIEKICDYDRKRMKSYIFAILKNECRNVMKDYSESLSAGDCDYISDKDFFDKLDISLFYQETVEVIKLLDERYSIPMLFYYANDMSVDEIAELMGIPAKTVYTRLARGKSRVLEIMGKGDGEK